MAAMDEKSSISNCYRDKNILVTGATGFIGKALLEKLLRSCPDIKTIYLILRPRKDLDAKQRLEELFKAKLFDRVKEEQPNALAKVVAIQADITADKLGINPYDEKLITDNVSIVFHSAAIVRFNCPLKKIFNSNVLGTLRLVQLCRNIQNLEALIHISTTYLDCDQDSLEEVAYQFPTSSKKVIDALEWMGEDLTNALTPHLLRGAPNTYSYTKALTEAYLAEECYDLPIAIVRPSIVASAWREPFPGWVDNYNSCTGILVAASKGVIRCFYCNLSAAVDMIPVDVLVNLIIASGWQMARHQTSNLVVYNCVSSSVNKITWEQFKDYATSSVRRYPSSETFRYPWVILTSSKTMNNIVTSLFHTIPAYFYDCLLAVTGHKPKLVQLYSRIHQQLELEERFILRDWTFVSKNALMLKEKMPPEDKKEFDFNIRHMSWPAYMEGYVLGIRQYLLEEKPSSLKPARKNLERLFLYDWLAKYICIPAIPLVLLLVFWNY